MYTFTQKNDQFYARSLVHGIEVMAATADEAREDLRRQVAFAEFRRWHDREVRRATKVAFDPSRRCYVAECPDMGLEAEGFTRTDAYNKILAQLRELAMSQLVASEELGTSVEENASEDR